MQFGFGKEKKKKADDWVFDLENDAKHPIKSKEIKDKISSCIQDLKTILRQGEDKKLFDETQVLLNGYLAAQKVIQRVQR